MHIHHANREDLPEVARIHVQAWQEAYAGLLPQDYLDHLSVATRLVKWREVFGGTAAGYQGSNLLVAREGEPSPAHGQGAAMGFVSFGPARESRHLPWGEIYAVYVLRKYWGTGVGHALYSYARQHFAQRGIPGAYLWVLDTNTRARRAYQRWGGRLDPAFTLSARIGGQDVTEVMMRFEFEE
ncbi:GNAT family N-acetyltransferase [Verrucomicrobia bacterium LW23]|nr:GNAT family N-acetyltransferase [Verrucomicrobia bacterium LW23]